MTKRAWYALFILLLTSQSATASVLFFEDFEGDLSRWTGKSGGASSATIVDDPLEPDRALTFTEVHQAGDLFTLTSFAAPGDTFRLSFDYLGDPTLGGIPNDLGGYIGISRGFPGTHDWIAGTLAARGTFSVPRDVLIDDGSWHHVELVFTSVIGSPVHLMVEDCCDDVAGSVPGDVYFDNIRLESLTVGEPSSWMLLGLAFVFFTRHRGEHD